MIKVAALDKAERRMHMALRAQRGGGEGRVAPSRVQASTTNEKGARGKRGVAEMGMGGNG